MVGGKKTRGHYCFISEQFAHVTLSTIPGNRFQSPMTLVPLSPPHSSQMDLYDQRAPQARRYPPSVSSSPQKDVQPKVRVLAEPVLVCVSFPDRVKTKPSRPH